MSDDVRSERTDFGFRFGAALVEQIMTVDGRVVIGVKTDTGAEIHVYVSRTGRSLRVFRRGKGEMIIPKES